MPNIPDPDGLLPHLLEWKEAFMEAFIAETGCRPEMVQQIHKKGDNDHPETFRFVVRK
jgi:hypothetical protein